MTNQEGGFHSTSEAVAKLGKMTVRSWMVAAAG